MSDSLWPHGLYSPWNSPGQNTGVGSLSLLQGIFSTQGSNAGICLAGGLFTSWTTREAGLRIRTGLNGKMQLETGSQVEPSDFSPWIRTVLDLFASHKKKKKRRGVVLGGLLPLLALEQELVEKIARREVKQGTGIYLGISPGVTQIWISYFFLLFGRERMGKN